MRAVATESNLNMAYLLEPGDGSRYVFVVCVLSAAQVQNVFRGKDTTYRIVAPMEPPGHAYPFLKGVPVAASYVQEKTGLAAYAAALLSYIMPLITTMQPSEQVLARAAQFVEKVKAGDYVVEL